MYTRCNTLEMPATPSIFPQTGLAQRPQQYHATATIHGQKRSKERCIMCSFKSVSCMPSTAGINSLYLVQQFRQFTLTIHRLLTVLTYNKRSILEINIEYYIVCVRLFQFIQALCYPELRCGEIIIFSSSGIVSHKTSCGKMIIFSPREVSPCSQR